MENKKKQQMGKKTGMRVFAMILTAAFVLLDICSVPVMAENTYASGQSALIQQATSAGRAGMAPVDISREAIDAAEVSKEQLMQQFAVDEEDLEVAEAEFAAECVTIPAETTASETEMESMQDAVSDNSVSEDTIELSADRAVYATPEDAADYLREKMTQRKELVTVKVSGVSNIKNYSANDYAYSIILDALEYDIYGEPDEGDYIYYHLARLAWQGEKGSNSYTLRFGFDYRTTASEEKYVTKKVNSIVKDLNLKSSSLNDYEKVRLIYDYIMSIVTYDYYHYEVDQSYNYMYTTYAALAHGTAVCQAYATLFYRLCEEAGISARVIPGNNATHGWNIVRIGNCYYNVDATWDDGDVPTYDYFLKSEAEFYDHTRDAECNTSAFRKEFPMAAVSYRLPEEESSASMINLSNLSGTITLTDGTPYSLTASGKAKVFFFLNPGENGTPAMLSKFYDIEDMKNGSCEGVIVDIYDSYADAATTPETLMAYIQSRTNTPYYYKYSSALETGMNYKNQYAALAGKSGSSKSAVVVIDGSNRLRYYGEGAVAMTDLKTLLPSVTNTVTMGTVSGLKALQTKNNAVKLTWNAYGGAGQYLVYRKTGNGNYYCLGSTSKNTFTDEVAAKKSYTYKVCALKGNVQIGQSGEVKVTTKQMLPKKGKTYTLDGNKYKVLTSSPKSKTVAFNGVSNKNATYVEIPATVKIDGISYKVTEVAANALKNKKKVKTVVIGANVTKIGSKAFYGAKKLINISVKSKNIKTVGGSALKGISSKAEIKVPSSKYSKYKKLFASKGQKNSVKIKK